MGRRVSALRTLGDLISKLSGAAIVALAVLLFAGGAFAGLSIVGRLGGAGWIIYFVVMSSYALVFGPMIVSGVVLAQRGSRRRREATAQRIEAERRKFGLPSGGLGPPSGRRL